MTTMTRALSVIAIAFAATVGWNSPRLPEPAALDAPAGEFSAARARETIHRVLGPNTPHPTGSPENAAVRERLVAELRQLGVEPEIQAGWGCRSSCADVRNVVVRLPGRRPDALLMLSHYDSVPAGPGGADDGFGTAVMLETLRALLAEPLAEPADSLVFLFSDAEELGLVGASHFAMAHPEVANVRAVINVEARGTGGPAHLFETGPQSGHLVSAFAELCPAPSGSSSMSAIYQLMPNDSDYSVFRDRGIPGLNLALTGEPTHYHTRHDQFDRIDPGTVQQVGACTLALARRFVGGGLEQPAPPRIFGLVPGIGVVHWSEPVGPWVAIAALLLTLGVGRRIAGGMGPLAIGGLSLILASLTAMAAAFLCQLLIATLSGGPAPWTAHPLPAFLALAWAGGMGAWGAIAGLRRARANTWLAVFAASLVTTSLLGVAAAFLLPGMAWPWVIGAVLLGLPALLPRHTSAALLAGIATLLWLPTVRSLGSLDLSGPTLGLIVALWLPAIAQGFASESRSRPAWRAALRPALAAAAVLVVLVTVAVRVPPFSEERPQGLVLLYHEDEDRGARWFARSASGPIPETVTAAGSLEHEMQSHLPFAREFFASRAGPVEDVASALPIALAVEPGPEEEADAAASTPSLRRRTLRLRSERGASRISLALPPGSGLEAARVQGVTVTPASEKRLGFSKGWRIISISTLPEEGALVELTLRGSDPIEAWLFDVSSELPASGAALVDARPEWAASQHSGDASVVSRRIRIE